MSFCSFSINSISGYKRVQSIGSSCGIEQHGQLSHVAPENFLPQLKTSKPIDIDNHMTSNRHDSSLSESRSSLEKLSAVCLSPSSVVERISDSARSRAGSTNSKQNPEETNRQSIMIPLCWDKSIKEQVQYSFLAGMTLFYDPQLSPSQICSSKTCPTASQSTTQETATKELAAKEVATSKRKMGIAPLPSEILPIKTEESRGETGASPTQQYTEGKYTIVTRKECNSHIQGDASNHTESTCDPSAPTSLDISIEPFVNVNVGQTDDKTVECCSLGSAELQERAAPAVDIVVPRPHSEPQSGTAEKIFEEVDYPTLQGSIRTTATLIMVDSPNEEHASNIAIEPSADIVVQEEDDDSVECCSSESSLLQQPVSPQHESAVSNIIPRKERKTFEEEVSCRTQQQTKIDCRGTTSNPGGDAFQRAKESNGPIEADSSNHTESAPRSQDMFFEPFVHVNVNQADDKTVECCRLGSAESAVLQELAAAEHEIAVPPTDSEPQSGTAEKICEEEVNYPTVKCCTSTTATLLMDDFPNDEYASNIGPAQNQDIAVEPSADKVVQEHDDVVECCSTESSSLQQLVTPQHECFVTSVDSKILPRLARNAFEEEVTCPEQQTKIDCRGSTSKLGGDASRNLNESVSVDDSLLPQVVESDAQASYDDVEEYVDDSTECSSVGSYSSKSSNLSIGSDDSECLIGIHRPSYEIPNDFDGFLFRPLPAPPQPSSSLREPPSTITAVNTTVQVPGSHEAIAFVETQQEVTPKKRFTPFLKVNTSLALAVVSEEEDEEEEQENGSFKTSTSSSGDQLTSTSSSICSHVQASLVDLTTKPSNKIFVLLLEPTTRIFEIIQFVYPIQSTVLLDIIKMIRLNSSDPTLASQTYVGLTRPKKRAQPFLSDQLSLLATSSFVTSTDDDSDVSSIETPAAAGIGKGEVLLAIPERGEYKSLVRFAKEILANRDIRKLVGNIKEMKVKEKGKQSKKTKRKKNEEDRSKNTKSKRRTVHDAMAVHIEYLYDPMSQTLLPNF